MNTRTGWLYFAVIMLQFFVFFNNVGLIAHMSNITLFYMSLGAYVLSLILLVIAIVRGAKAGGGNCFMVLLFIVNLFIYMWYFFYGFLNSFVHGGQ